MLAFQPAKIRPEMGREVARSIGAPVPPPGPDPLFTGYTGVPGFLEMLAVLTVAGAATWVGIETGMGDGSRAMRAAGWIGGVGSALIGLLYVGGKAGVTNWLPLPSVRVVPA